ncbi:MAG: hypothetical protein ACKVU2_10895 [Saprospiraceae bacterium]
MAQVSWVYLDDFGGRHRIGLYHGDRTGHLLLHCNALIVQVDFSVKETRTYSFFVEDELCEVSVVREPQGFTYDFQVNKRLDTPRNRLRKSDERRTRKYMAVMVVGLVLLVSTAVLGLRWWGQRHKTSTVSESTLSARLTPENERVLASEGRTAVAQMIVVQEALRRRVFYGFTTTQNTQISGLISVPDTGQIVLPNGFPLRDRDEFAVRYLPADPRIHQIDFGKPSSETVAGYLELARVAEVAAHPENSPGHSLCVATLVLRQQGWHRLADLVFQQVPAKNNPRNNRETYLRLVREGEFAKLADRECWDR